MDGETRHLLVRTRAFERDTPVKFTVVWTRELADYQASGWKVIVDDPEPYRYEPIGPQADDGA